MSFGPSLESSHRAVSVPCRDHVRVFSARSDFVDSTAPKPHLKERWRGKGNTEGKCEERLVFSRRISWLVYCFSLFNFCRHLVGISVDNFTVSSCGEARRLELPAPFFGGVDVEDDISVTKGVEQDGVHVFGTVFHLFILVVRLTDEIGAGNIGRGRTDVREELFDYSDGG